MRKLFLLNYFLIPVVVFIFVLISSCASTKRTKYFQDIPDSGQLKTIPAAEYLEPKVLVDDILSVNVQTIDPIATQNINAGNISNTSSSSALLSATSTNQNMPDMSLLGQNQLSSGYLVDKEGDINVPVLGKVNVAGHTISEVQGIIFTLSSKYYNNPTVNVRFANFRVTVTGEVMKPGQYIMPTQKVNVLDAIAMAGDLTIYGKRDNVLLIRTNLDGTRTPYRINLKKSNILSASYYYLQQNDLIYVEPASSKAAATDASAARNYTIIGSVLSILAIIATRK